MTEDLAGERRNPMASLFLLAAVFVVLAPLFWRHVELRRIGAVESDHPEQRLLYAYVYPVYHHAFGRLADGEMPLWNPHQLDGLPLHADPRVGLFQPLHVVFAFLPTQQAMAVHAFLCLSLMGFGCAVVLRSLGTGLTAALFGGIAFAFCGASAAAMSHPATASALAWSPWAFWALHEHLRTWRWEFVALGAVFGAMMLLSGALPIVIAMGCLFALYGTAGVIWPRSADSLSVSRRLRGPIIMAGLALLMAAVQWVPTMLWMGSLERPGDLLWSLSLTGQAPQTLRGVGIQALLARRGAEPRLAYVGIAALLLLPPALAHWSQRRHVAFFLIMLPLLLGAYIVGPGPWSASFPRTAFVYPAVFVVAILTGLGADRLLSAPQGYRTSSVLWPGLLTLLTAALLFYVAGAQVRGYILALLVLLIPVLFLRNRWMLVIGGVAVSAPLFVDLSVASSNVHRHPFMDAPACYEPHRATFETAAAQAEAARILVSGGRQDRAILSNGGLVYGVYEAGGVGFPLTRGQAAWWNRLSNDRTERPRVAGDSILPSAQAPRLLNYMAARIFITTPDSPLYEGQWTSIGPRLTLASTVGDVRIYENDDALPRAFWTPHWRSGYGAEAAADMLAGAEFNPDRECLLDQAPALPEPASDGPIHTRKDAECTVETLTPEEVVVRVSAPADGITVLLDSWAPGWTATRNGDPVPILRANGLYRGVATPAGDHEIVFYYRPWGIRAGGLISALGAALALHASMGFRLPRSWTRRH